MLILAVDTSGPLVSVALHDGSTSRGERSTPDPRHHAELLAPAVTELLAEAGQERSALTAIVVGVGPGPFTGLRVGLVTARVLGHALGLPVHGVCSLDAQAQAAVVAAGLAPGAEFLVATDARRREVYWARYRVLADDSPADCSAAEGLPAEGSPADGSPAVTRLAAGRLDGPRVDPPAVAAEAGLPVVGRAAVLYPQLGPALEPLDVTAGQVAELAAGVLTGRLPAGAPGLLPPDPLYLRRPDAAEPAGRKRVRGGVAR